MSDFDDRWHRAMGFRHVTPELRPLVAALDRDLAGQDPAAVRTSLLALLEHLASGRGRTDANCCVVDTFFAGVDAAHLPDDLRAVVTDLSGTLHDTIYAPRIAENFGCLPEQLLERARKLAT